MTVLIDQDYLLESGVHPFIVVPAHPEPVMVRTLDFKVNATHILKVAGQERQMQQQLQRIRRYHHGALDSVIGGSKYKGTYVGFDIAMGLCRRYGLVELESRIRCVCLNGQVLFPASRPSATSSGLAPPLRVRRLASPHPPLSPRYKDLHPSLFSHFPLYLFSISIYSPLASSYIIKIYIIPLAT